MPISEGKRAAMRAAFLADLTKRLSEIDSLAGRLQAEELSAEAARAAALTHLHDIKGCGVPYGFPEATAMARDYEIRLQSGELSAAELCRMFVELGRSLRGVTT